MSAKLHEQDFYAWTVQQAELLRAGRLAELDTEYLLGELESMGARERRELINRLAVLLAHLLKWQYQPGFRGRSWQLTIKEQRRRLQRLLDDNPSLAARLDEFLPDAYEDAVLLASRETGLDETAFPAQCPYRGAAVLEAGFYPGA
jgi:hypothetical protein